MDRRAFLAKALLAVGVVAASAGAAEALPILPTHETLAPEGNVENSWWYRRRYWRRRYYWHRPWRRRYYW